MVWLVATAAIGLSLGCGEKIEPGRKAAASAPPVKAVLAEARREPWPLWFEVVGTVQAEISGTLSAKLMGAVTGVRVKEGDRVQAGDALVTIDGREAAARRGEAEAALAEARRARRAAESGRDAAAAGAELAAVTYRRYQTLFAQESVSRQEFDEVASRYLQTQAARRQSEAMLQAAAERVRQAEAAFEAARISAADAVVTAPFAGRVTAKLVDVGDLAAPGRPLVSLEQDGGQRVEIQVPELHVQAVRPGATVSVTLGGPQAAPVEAVVEAVSPAADPQTRSFLVKVRLPGGAPARSGMFARVAVAIGEEHLLAVPASAVVRQGQLTGLFLVGLENIARFRLIRTGRRLGERVEVLSGLPEGARFVVNPPPELSDGARVETPA